MSHSYADSAPSAEHISLAHIKNGSQREHINDKAGDDVVLDMHSADDDSRDRALVRKVDWHLVPWLSLLYLLSFLDRTNIGNANLFGLSVDLHLNPNQYSFALAIFFIFYVIFEVPSNLVMKAWRPSMWLPIIMIGWGGVMVGMGFVKNYHHLLAARTFLGVTEAGLFPGVAFFLTQWYRRFEVNFRIAIFFSAATFAGAFGGLLARLINMMDGTSGYEGWRWIFILEGIATVVIATASFWMLYDYPVTATFLNRQERERIVERLHLDHDGLSTAYNTTFIKQAFLDWKVWAFALQFHFALMSVYSFSLFSPTLVAGMGYTAARAQLMSVPPYVLAAITTVAAGYLSDRTQKRAIFVMIFSVISSLGFIMLISTHIPGVQYTGLFFAAAGSYPLTPLVVAWGTNNAGGALKRGVAAAIIVSTGNAGGVISSYTYPKTTAPRYYRGHGINLAYNVAGCILAGILWWILARKNAEKDARNAQRGPWTMSERKEHEDEGDDAEFFKYAI